MLTIHTLAADPHFQPPLTRLPPYARCLARGLAGLTILLVMISRPLADAAQERPVLSPVPGSSHPLRVISEEWNAAGTQVVVHLRAADGIFVFTLHPLAAPPLTRLLLIVDGERFCEGFTFHPLKGEAVDLRTLPGVKITPGAEGLVVEITPPALAALQAGGGGQFINQFR